MTTKIHFFFVDENSEHKKAKGVNRNAAATISHNEYKDVLLNNKCLRHSMNKIQSKDHGKIYIQNNEYDVLAFGY